MLIAGVSSVIKPDTCSVHLFCLYLDLWGVIWVRNILPVSGPRHLFMLLPYCLPAVGPRVISSCHQVGKLAVCLLALLVATGLWYLRLGFVYLRGAPAVRWHAPAIAPLRA